MTKGVICPRCGVGIDTDGDGNCATCAKHSDAEIATWERGDGKQQEARVPVCESHYDCSDCSAYQDQAEREAFQRGQQAIATKVLYLRGLEEGKKAMAEKAAQLRKLIALYREQYPMEENRSGWGLAFEIERSLAGAEIPGQSPDVPKEAGAVRQAALSIRAVEAAADKGRG